MSERRKLPPEREAKTHKFRIGRYKFYLTCGKYPDGTLGEIFLKSERAGSTLAGLLDGFSIAFSMALQSGTPLETLVEKFVNTRFEPAGFTGFEEIPSAHSPLDYVARYLALRFLGPDGKQIKEEKLLISIPPVAEREVPVVPDREPLTVQDPGAPAVVKPSAPTLGGPSDGPACTECGGLLIPTGHCWACPTCGTTTGCS